MSMQFNKPKFDSEAKDYLSELEQFKQECSVLFDDPCQKCRIGCQCTMTLHSMGITLDKPKTVFDSLESIFRPESHQTLRRSKFRGLKQRQSQT